MPPLGASIAQWLERRPSDPAVVRLSPGRGKDIYVPAMLRSKYHLANKGYAQHQFLLIHSTVGTLLHCYISRVNAKQPRQVWAW